MNTDYEKSSFEQKAFELLAPLAGNCPDSVWDNVNIELAARKAEADNKWFKKAVNSPKTVLVAAGVIAVVTLSSWMLFMNKGGHTTVAANTTVQQAPQPVKQTPVKEDKPVPVAVAANTNNTADQNPVPAPAPVVNQPMAQSPVIVHNTALVTPVPTPAPLANKPTATAPQKPVVNSANTNGSPLIGHNDPVFDVSASPDAATLKGNNKQSSDSSATVHRGVSSVQAEIPIMDTAQ